MRNKLPVVFVFLILSSFPAAAQKATLGTELTYAYGGEAIVKKVTGSFKNNILVWTRQSRNVGMNYRGNFLDYLCLFDTEKMVWREKVLLQGLLDKNQKNQRKIDCRAIIPEADKITCFYTRMGEPKMYVRQFDQNLQPLLQETEVFEKKYFENDFLAEHSFRNRFSTVFSDKYLCGDVILSADSSQYAFILYPEDKYLNEIEFRIFNRYLRNTHSFTTKLPTSLEKIKILQINFTSDQKMYLLTKQYPDPARKKNSLVTPPLVDSAAIFELYQLDYSSTQTDIKKLKINTPGLYIQNAAFLMQQNEIVCYGSIINYESKKYVIDAFFAHSISLPGFVTSSTNYKKVDRDIVGKLSTDEMRVPEGFNQWLQYLEPIKKGSDGFIIPIQGMVTDMNGWYYNKDAVFLFTGNGNQLDGIDGVENHWSASWDMNLAGAPGSFVRNDTLYVVSNKYSQPLKKKGLLKLTLFQMDGVLIEENILTDIMNENYCVVAESVFAVSDKEIFILLHIADNTLKGVVRPLKLEF